MKTIKLIISYYFFKLYFRKYKYLYPHEYEDFVSRYPLLWKESDPDLLLVTTIRMKCVLDVMKEKLDCAKTNGIV